MTVAVCLYCGFIKHGAFTPCGQCGKVPKSSEDQAKSLLITDHYQDDRALDLISRGIQNGISLQFPDYAIACVKDRINKMGLRLGKKDERSVN